jgi:hypothetical protein
MSRSGLLYALFCLAVVALYFLTARAAWSPFADGGRTGFFYTRGGVGPRHK